jgi:glucokinase-like ROK family protein
MAELKSEARESIAMASIQDRLRKNLIVSCQAAPGDPLDDTETIRRIARAAVAGGAGGLRINSAAHMAAIRQDTDLPIIGIQKRYRDGRVQITPDFASASALAAAGASIVALDCTAAAEAEGESWEQLIARIHGELKLPVMADISTAEEARAAQKAGADFVGTTLNGYTPQTHGSDSFDWSLLTVLVEQLNVPIIAEGHIWTPQDARRALAAGAWCVVVGSAITRPRAITENFLRAMKPTGPQSPAIGVDIGGTTIKAGVVDVDGEVTFPVRLATDAHKGRSAIAAGLVQAVQRVISLASQNDIEPIGLGIATAGAISSENGAVFAATENLPEWTGFNLREFAQEQFRLPTFVVNDAHAAVLAELRFGQGRELSDFVAITLGTGIGGGIVCNGKILHGQHGFAGTIGHQTIRMDGRPCNCGRNGCLEAYVSTAALVREYGTHAGTDLPTCDNAAQAVEISRLALAGDPAARRAYTVLSGYLAEGIANIFNLLDPQVVFLSGGLVDRHTEFAEEVECLTRELLHFGSKRQPIVRLAQAGHYAGVQGAGSLVFEGLLPPR